MSEIRDLVAARHATRAGARATAEEKADAHTLTPSQQRARADAIRAAWHERLSPSVTDEKSDDSDDQSESGGDRADDAQPEPPTSEPV